MPRILNIPSLYNDANLQEYYQLEDTSGKNGNTLTNNNTCTFVPAKFLNGVSGGTVDADKCLSIASALGWTGGAYAMSFWLKINTAPSSATYNITEVFEGTNDTSLLIEYVDTAGTKTIAFHRLRVGVADATFSATQDLGTTLSHHIVITYDGSTLRGYINGVDVGNVAASGNGNSLTTSNFKILAGRNDTTTNNALAIVDDFALFDRNLTATEVRKIYSAGGVLVGEI